MEKSEHETQDMEKQNTTRRRKKDMNQNPKTKNQIQGQHKQESWQFSYIWQLLLIKNLILVLY